MFSPALRHRQQKLARRAGIEAPKGAPAFDNPYGETPGAAEYANLLAALHENLRRLHEIESLERKIEAKRGMFPLFQDWVDGALAIEDAATAPQDVIVVTMMIWAADIGEWDRALQIFDHVLKHHLAMPEHYRRSPAAFIVEQLAEAAIAEPGSISHEQLERVRPGKGAEWDMPDQVAAKFHRALGESWARRAETFEPDADSAPAGGKPALVAAAIAELERAIQLNDHVGSKTMLRDLQREAKKLEAAAGQSGGGGEEKEKS
jgi:hypothetical protein